jgi:hypothetical protein
MFTATIESTLQADWRRATTAFVRGLRSAVSDAVTQGAEEARTTHQYTDRTGDLTKSISGQLWGGEDPLGAEGTIEAGMFYASFVENGHAISHFHDRRDEHGRFAAGRGWHDTRARAFPFMGQADLKAERVLEAGVDVAVQKMQDALDASR